MKIKRHREPITLIIVGDSILFTIDTVKEIIRGMKTSILYLVKGQTFSSSAKKIRDKKKK